MTSTNINLIYPSPNDFYNRFDEGSHPQIFNYFCLHGYQVFIVRHNKVYEVFTRSWRSASRKFISEYIHSLGYSEFYYCRSKNIFHCMTVFRRLCAELLTTSKAIFTEYNPLMDTVLQNEMDYGSEFDRIYGLSLSPHD